MVTENSSPSRKEAWKMFDRIAGRYDILNRILSFGQDIYWRKRLAASLNKTGNRNLLDIASGTADVLIEICGSGNSIQTAAGIDMSGKMLERGRKKISRLNIGNIYLLPGDASAIPFKSGTFDAVTIAFGIRNVLDVSEALKDMRRILSDDGQVFILEFSLPANRLLRRCYLFYFRNILPGIGGLISGDSEAYRYLNRTVETFPYGGSFKKIMSDAGFSDVTVNPLSLGIATLYTGIKT